MSESKFTGEISVTTEHIFPIIKRWLYSDKDIFLRELVSNASDAITKLSRLRCLGDAPEGDAGRIDVKVDAAAGTLTVSDNGIGMTGEEVDRYLGQIALSGALEFLQKYEGENAEADGIIGHFGLGFYSAFMIAGKVEVVTKSYTDAPAVRWVCTDAGTFEQEETAGRTAPGTDVILYVTEEEKDYLKKEKITEILEKYCAFLAYPIYLAFENEEKKEGEEEKPVNDTAPLWQKNPADITEEEYKDFYHKLFGYGSEPLFWVHLNADYPLNFKGILYFPRLDNPFASMEGEVKLYYNRVFVADNISEVVPEYLLSLKGVLDCPELPLNVSRSFLQTSPYVSKLSAHISKKVCDRLGDIFKNDRERYEGFSHDLRPFLEYGALKDHKFFERTKDLVVFGLCGGGYATVEEYLDGGEDKRVFYTPDPVRQAHFVKLLSEEGKKIFTLDTVLDSQYISLLENETEGLGFLRADSATEVLSEGTAQEDAELTDLFRSAVPEGVEIELVHLKNTETPAIFSTSEKERRFADMMEMYRARGAMPEGMDLPRGEKLCVNLSSPACRKLVGEVGEKRTVLARGIYYAALIAARTLTEAELGGFLENSNRLFEL